MVHELLIIDPDVDFRVQEITVAPKQDNGAKLTDAGKSSAETIYGNIQVVPSRIGLGTRPKEIHKDLLADRPLALGHEKLEYRLALTIGPVLYEAIIEVDLEGTQAIDSNAGQGAGPRVAPVKGPRGASGDSCVGAELSSAKRPSPFGEEANTLPWIQAVRQ